MFADVHKLHVHYRALTTLQSSPFSVQDDYDEIVMPASETRDFGDSYASMPEIRCISGLRYRPKWNDYGDIYLQPVDMSTYCQRGPVVTIAND